MHLHIYICAEVRSRLLTLLKSHSRTDAECVPENSQHTRRTPSSGRTPLGDCFCRKSFKRLKL